MGDPYGGNPTPERREAEHDEHTDQAGRGKCSFGDPCGACRRAYETRPR